MVLRIGNRSSSNYYRVYQKQNGLQFELELKNQLVKSFQKLLMDNSIQEFEHKLSKHFYRQSFESLNLNSYYMDWLLHWYRQSSPKKNSIDLLTTSVLLNYYYTLHITELQKLKIKNIDQFKNLKYNRN